MRASTSAGKGRKNLAITRAFYREIYKRHRLTEQDKTRCISAVCQFVEGPTLRGLNFEKLGSNLTGNLWSLRASQELRIILAVDHERYIVANAGHHDPMYAWADRRQFYVDPDTEEYAEFLVSIPGIPVSLQGRLPIREKAEPAEPLHDERETVDGSPDIAMSEGMQVQDMWEEHLPYSSSYSDEPTLSISEIQHLIKRMFLGDFEEWALFLHPDQKPLVKQQWSGAARIRGAAGTGKTVVGLHRAAELARRYPHETILFTTFSRSLCEILKARYRGLQNAPSNVEFANIDTIVYKYDSRWVEYGLVDQAFDTAYREVIAGSPLERLGRKYLRDEIERVIKGNGLQDLESYLSIERLGRKRSFPRDIRRRVWELSTIWDRELQKRHAVRHVDTRIRARDIAQGSAQSRYRCVVVDEAQDMTLVEMQLVRALVAGAPHSPLPDDGVLILDDAAQRIYAGGYRLRWAGLEISGRSHILKRNYRNVPAIYRAAKGIRGNVLVAAEDDDDGSVIDVEFDLPDGDLEEPVFYIVDSKGESPFLQDKIREITGRGECKHNEIAIFVKHNRQVVGFMQGLKSGRIPCAQLKPSGISGNGVRVGTFDRAKGLEFRVVFIPCLGKTQFPPTSESDGPARQGTDNSHIHESRLLELDRLYVAMTRAREQLFMIADEDPCDEIRRALGEEIVLRDLRGQA